MSQIFIRCSTKKALLTFSSGVTTLQMSRVTVWLRSKLKWPEPLQSNCSSTKQTQQMRENRTIYQAWKTKIESSSFKELCFIYLKPGKCTVHWIEKHRTCAAGQAGASMILNWPFNEKTKYLTCSKIASLIQSAQLITALLNSRKTFRIKISF